MIINFMVDYYQNVRYILIRIKLLKCFVSGECEVKIFGTLTKLIGECELIHVGFVFVLYSSNYIDNVLLDIFKGQSCHFLMA